jgi:SAM-dependent methyltransferase
MDYKSHWEDIYQQQSPTEVSWYQAEPRLSLELIQRAAPGKDAAILDVGGGASRLVDCLLAAGYRDLSVLDVAKAALAHARQRLGARADEVTWLEADITHFTPPRRYDLWHDRATFHFLTEAAERARYVAALRQSLKPGGQLILATFAVGGPKTCSGLNIRQYDAPRLQSELGAGFKLLEERTEAHTTPAGKPQAFYYSRWQVSGETV